jgi:diguanylate cyclase (GGDEF)-like protein
VRSKNESGSVAINDNLQINATVSIGCASITPGAMSLDDALKQADKALYEAKAQGRNRVIFAG